MSRSHSRPSTLPLSREEAWAAHAAVLGFLRDVEEPDHDAVAVLEALEADEGRFDRTGLRTLAAALSAYLVSAPERDRAAAERALVTVERTLGR